MDRAFSRPFSLVPPFRPIDSLSGGREQAAKRRQRENPWRQPWGIDPHNETLEPRQGREKPSPRDIVRRIQSRTPAEISELLPGS